MFRRVAGRLRSHVRLVAAFARQQPVSRAVLPTTLVAAGLGSFFIPTAKVTQAQGKAKRVAIYGGAFDPPTNSHMTCASEIVHSGCADEVWLVPCGPRPDKPKLKTPALDRYCMCQIAVNTVFSPDFPIKVSDIDTRREMAAFTYDLLCSLRDQHPGVHFAFVIGSDWLQPGTNIAEWTSLNHAWKPGMPESEKFIVTGNLKSNNTEEKHGFHIGRSALKWVSSNIEVGVQILSQSRSKRKSGQAHIFHNAQSQSS
ncbi:Probable nicotinate-nucleotide adenylyltransferase (Deamido-NAD(+) diphosphorylase) (Deamido-NAD(+) pyrophosphorylase) (Nicotinate mononucleotide adenylyltransferase) (NaMN adenylyltransferase) [Durusdinium trenchii]|uniref:Probable nicotinate-nucleotide adenylyltransferase (Deamido-NAD(+) diphosphorylase) (Deamido-NAD(+) pyrophosphorylase) (Nicotinate mononucleotide adenylyltransferase) (NaMN adenylyltransferase) n=1 Tax=Durusdinium trenchii TaxID=1381693 RepID=A0ABP0L8Y6_9DINO